MYYPFFRGKQFELITIRETAEVLADNDLVPIIEPVRESLGGLERALDAICEVNGTAIVIVNPFHGDHHEKGEVISALLKKKPFTDGVISAGILLRGETTIDDAIAYYDAHKGNNPTFVHAGFNEHKALAGYIGASLPESRHVFVDKCASILYRKHFEGSTRILMHDGFNVSRNADYPPIEVFSDLHVAYAELKMDGFGDFLIVGDRFSESGGPAYAVAIHLTFIDHDQDDVMYIYHFVSDTKDTPTDPAGKFAQALKKLITKLDSGDSKLIETNAIMQFRELHAKGHFPGLGYVKKLSMNHHIETLAAYLG